MHTDAGREWGLALVLLTAVSILFASLRLLGHAFIVLEFEWFVVYLPTTLCLAFFLLKKHAVFSSERKDVKKSHEATG